MEYFGQTLPSSYVWLVLMPYPSVVINGENSPCVSPLNVAKRYCMIHVAVIKNFLTCCLNKNHLLGFSFNTFSPLRARPGLHCHVLLPCVIVQNLRQDRKTSLCSSGK